MNKLFYISLILVAISLAGCATPDPRFQPQGQTYGAGTHFHANNENEVEDIFNIVSNHAVRVPQQDSFSLHWYTEVSRRGGFQRYCRRIVIHPGGSFTSGTYPCLAVETEGGTQYGDRIFEFEDPELGVQRVNLSMINGGYLTSESCDRGFYNPGRSETYDVQWSTHDTIRGARGFWAQLSRHAGCEVAPRDEVKIAKRIHRLRQQEELRRMRDEIRGR